MAAVKERMDERTEGREAGTHHTNIAFDRGPDHDGNIIPGWVVGGDGGIGVDADNAHG